MAIELTGTVKPKGNFPIAVSEDVILSDGTRLSEQPIVKVTLELPEDAAEHPNILYIIVDSLSDRQIEQIFLGSLEVQELWLGGVHVWSYLKYRFFADIIANADMTGTLAKSLKAKINSSCEFIANIDAKLANTKTPVSTAKAEIDTTAKGIRALAKLTNATAKQNIETTAHFISVMYGLPSADILLNLDTIVAAKIAQTVKGNSLFAIKQDADVSAKSVEVIKTNSIGTALTVSSAQTAKSIDKVNHGSIATETQINSVCKAYAIVPQKIKANGIIDIAGTATVLVWKDPVQSSDTLLITQVYSATQNGDILEVS